MLWFLYTESSYSNLYLYQFQQFLTYPLSTLSTSDFLRNFGNFANGFAAFPWHFPNFSTAFSTVSGKLSVLPAQAVRTSTAVLAQKSSDCGKLSPIFRKKHEKLRISVFHKLLKTQWKTGESCGNGKIFPQSVTNSTVLRYHWQNVLKAYHRR